MTIFIGKAKMTDKGATEFISKQHDLVRQIVRAWCQSNIDHHFKNDKRFRKAVQKNQGILHSRGAIEALFTSRNYVFSTKAEDRKETLYFKDRATNGRGGCANSIRKARWQGLTGKARHVASCRKRGLTA